MSENRLTRDLEGAMLGGVCAGIAKRWNYDPTLIRVLAILVALLTAGTGILVYLALWFIMPRDDDAAAVSKRAADRAQELREELETAGDRIAASAKVIARSAREAAEEIAEIARSTPQRRETPPASEGADASTAGAEGEGGHQQGPQQPPPQP